LPFWNSTTAERTLVYRIDEGGRQLLPLATDGEIAIELPARDACVIEFTADPPAD
jgi:hypothetical protein